jgi:dihydroorotase
MIHVGDTRHTLGDILNMMRPGDWVSHFLTPRKYGILGTAYIPDATLIPEAAAAQDRGVIMDAARGGNHIGFPQMEAWLQAGRLPDTISSDVTVPGSADPNVAVLSIASALMAFGARFEDLLPRMTINSARGLKKDGLGIGKLQVNGIGDATILKIENGDFTFSDVNGWPKKGTQRILATGVVRAGMYSQAS